MLNGRPAPCVSPCLEELERRDVPSISTTLATHISTDLRHLARDASMALQTSTVRAQLMQDLQTLQQDVAHGSGSAIRADITQIGSDLRSSVGSLLSNTTLRTDLKHLFADGKAAFQQMLPTVTQGQSSSSGSMLQPFLANSTISNLVNNLGLNGLGGGNSPLGSFKGLPGAGQALASLLQNGTFSSLL
jgi:hypothetical protein